ncbi:MAG: S9 family peptidase [Ilumatobacteraceae bacterium]|nr:S9 family peptidase [Ilumatobacteraceae bacterium]
MTLNAPIAPRRPHTLVRPSGDVQDPYAWLLEKEDAETLQYLNDENEFCRQWFSSHASLTEQIFSTIKSRIQEDDASHPVAHGGWWYTSRTEAGKAYSIHSRGRSASTATDNVLIDENIEADGHDYFSLGAFEVSNNTRLLAWSSDTDGGEYFTLHIRDTETNTDSLDVISETAFGGVAWSTNDQWLFYVTPDEQMRPWQVWRHQVGTDVTDDVLVYEDADERFFVGVAASRSGQWIMIESSSKTSSETWILDASTPTAQLRSVAARRDDIEYTVDHWGTEFAIITNLGAVDFQVMTASTSNPSEWTPFLPHVAGERITQFECFESFAVMQRWVSGQQIISLVNKDASLTYVDVLKEPHEIELDTNPDFETDGIRLSYQSLTVPHTTAWYSLATGEVSTLKQVQVNACNVNNYVSERIWASSHDGVPVPVDIVHHRDTPLNGTAPAMVYVYGAYEISVAPWFSVARLSLLDQGWIWALAHPRGGGEMGRDWYLQGRLLHKRNTFTDTIAVATHLADSHICDGNKIVVRGASAGGLTVGACITMEPTRFAGAIAEVPFVDVVTTMSDPSLPLTVTEWEEWGDPRTEPYASYIASYSPYDNTKSVNYPQLYVTAGLNDPRVSYHEPAKWVARMRHESPTTTVVLKCDMGAGHGGPSGRYDQWRDEAQTLSFAIDCVQ